MVLVIALVAMLSCIAQAIPYSYTERDIGNKTNESEASGLTARDADDFDPWDPFILRTHYDSSLCLGRPFPERNTSVQLVSCDDAPSRISRFVLALQDEDTHDCLTVPWWEYPTEGDSMDIPHGGAVMWDRCVMWFAILLPPNRFTVDTAYAEGSNGLIIRHTPWDTAEARLCLAVGERPVEDEQKVCGGNNPRYRVGDPVVLRPCNADDYNQRWNGESRRNYTPQS